MSAPSQVWAANQLPNHSRLQLPLLQLFTAAKLFVGALWCNHQIVLRPSPRKYRSVLLCKSSPAAWAQTIWINLFFYVSQAVPAASRAAAAALVPAQSLRGAKSSFTPPPPPPPSSSHSKKLSLSQICVSLPEEILLPAGEKSGFQFRWEILFCWCLTALVGRAALCGWLWRLWCPDRIPGTVGCCCPHPRYHHSLTPPPDSERFRDDFSRFFLDLFCLTSCISCLCQLYFQRGIWQCLPPTLTYDSLTFQERFREDLKRLFPRHNRHMASLASVDAPHLWAPPSTHSQHH